MNPIVIYTVSGPDIHYKNLCKNSINSLIKYGEYKHDIVVLTDNKLQWDDFNFPNCKIINCLDEIIHSAMQRIFIPKYINLDPYSHIIYLDSDILIMNNIYKLLTDENNLLFAVEGQTIEQHWDNPIFCYNNCFFMTEKEKQTWRKEHTINDGQFVVPQKLFDVFFANWQNIVGKENNYGIDQSGFNVLIRRNIVPSKHLDPSLYCFSEDYSCKSRGVIINHFSINHKSGKYNTLVKELLGEKELVMNIPNNPPIYYRDYCNDSKVIKEVFQDNEYKLSKEDVDGKIVFDVGAHIGSFTRLALSLGAKSVISAEAYDKNYEYLNKNVSSFNNCIPINAAIMGNTTEKQITFKILEEYNTGSGRIGLSDGDISVPVVCFDELFEKYGCEVLKLDCEGSEYDIIYNSKKIKDVNLIIGEYHEFPLEKNRFKELSEYLTKLWFDVNGEYYFECSSVRLGHFKAVKKNTLYREHFDNLYKNGGWAGMGSGPGSNPQSNKEYLWLLNKIINYTPSIKTIIDLGCGDFQLMKGLQHNKQYIGIDVSNYIIQKNKLLYETPTRKFECMNIIDDNLPTGDLIIIKDVLQHLPIRDVNKILMVIKEYKYCLIINDYTDNNISYDIEVGQWRPINVLLPPYNINAITLYGYNGKHVVLWAN